MATVAGIVQTPFAGLLTMRACDARSASPAAAAVRLRWRAPGVSVAGRRTRAVAVARRARRVQTGVHMMDLWLLLLGQLGGRCHRTRMLATAAARSRYKLLCCLLPGLSAFLPDSFWNGFLCSRGCPADLCDSFHSSTRQVLVYRRRAEGPRHGTLTCVGATYHAR